MLIIILTVFCILITYVYVQWAKMQQYWAKRGVPHVPPDPLFGSLTFLQRENPGLWFRRIYHSLKYPYVGIWIFWRPGLVINSTEIARNILIKDQANFRNRLISSGTTDPVGGLNLFSLDDPLWSVIRKRLTFLFTSSKLRGVQNLITNKSKDLVKRIEKEKQKSSPMNLRSVLTDFSTDIIGSSTFGVMSDATLTGRSHFRSITDDFTKFSIIRGLAWCCVFFIPELVDFFRFKLFPEESTEYMRKIMRKIIAQRGGLENKIMEPRDLLDILIMLKQEGGEELDMTENMMLAQATVFLQGGFETIATILSFIIYELAFSPEIQERLNKELQTAKTKYSDNFLDASVLSQLTYLNCVIKEGFRKYPILGWLDRIALANYKVDDYLTIEAGTPIMVNLVGMHYDPDFYPDPDTFNPDRFLPENKVTVFLPFGDGPRKCIGQRLGLSVVRHGLAAVILNYKVRPIPNTPTPLDVKWEKKGFIIAPEEILTVDFVCRKNIRTIDNLI